MKGTIWNEQHKAIMVYSQQRPSNRQSGSPLACRSAKRCHLSLVQQWRKSPQIGAYGALERTLPLTAQCDYRHNSASDEEQSRGAPRGSSPRWSTSRNSDEDPIDARLCGPMERGIGHRCNTRERGTRGPPRKQRERGLYEEEFGTLLGITWQRVFMQKMSGLQEIGWKEEKILVI